MYNSVFIVKLKVKMGFVVICGRVKDIAKGGHRYQDSGLHIDHCCNRLI